jgi:hypothetical protein
VEAIPKKWKNVQKMCLKFTDSVALPFYAALPELAGAPQVAAAALKNAGSGGGSGASSEEAATPVTTGKRKRKTSDAGSSKKSKAGTKTGKRYHSSKAKS